MIQHERINRWNRRSLTGGRYVLYWMQAAQRANYNHALEYAIRRANELKQPVVVAFGLTADFPQANARFTFLFFCLPLPPALLSLSSGLFFILRMWYIGTIPDYRDPTRNGRPPI